MRIAVVKAIEALARLPTHPPGLEALTVLLLALRVLAGAAFFLRRHALLPLLLGLSNVIITGSVHAIDTATSLRVARHSVLEAVAVALGAPVLVTVALDLAIACCGSIPARLG